MSAINRSDNNLLAKVWESTEMTMAAYAAKRHVPLGGTFELTPRCNLKCKMCYVRLDRSEMDAFGRERTAKEWISLAEQAIEAGTLNLLITGGEPLIRSDFEEIYTALANMGFIIALNTNATLMTPKLLKLFERYPPTETNVTLYGASRETYGKICGNPGGFDQTIRGLEMLSGVSTVLEVRTTFIKDNMYELDELRSIANRFTNRYAINTNVFKSTRITESNAEDCRLSPKQRFDIVDDNMRYYENFNSGISEPAEKNIESDNFAHIKDYGFSLPPVALTCLAAKSMYWITWDGKMLPCGSFSAPYTLPFENGFKAAWDELPELFMNIRAPEECSKCEYSDGKCPNCPAMLQAETGQFDRISPYLCETAKEMERRYGNKK
jgi:radical SAM protein with 4Fe4S-binding SPASM domain